MIQLKNVTKTYTQGETHIEVLRGISLEIADGEKVAIVGASGSGKSTLLSIMSGMDSPDSGEVIIDGTSIASLNERELALFRNNTVGMIFQSFELVPAFTALENVLLPLDIRNTDDRFARASEALTKVGLSHRGTHRPSELSGGEEQRTAIARVLAQDPKIIFADEPTGNLDHTTGREILRELIALTSERAHTLIIITHDPSIAQMMDRTYTLKEGLATTA